MFGPGENFPNSSLSWPLETYVLRWFESLGGTDVGKVWEVCAKIKLGEEEGWSRRSSRRDKDLRVVLGGMKVGRLRRVWKEEGK